MLACDIARIINSEDNLLKLKNYMETHKTKDSQFSTLLRKECYREVDISTSEE